MSITRTGSAIRDVLAEVKTTLAMVQAHKQIMEDRVYDSAMTVGGYQLLRDPSGNDREIIDLTIRSSSDGDDTHSESSSELTSVSSDGLSDSVDDSDDGAVDTEEIAFHSGGNYLPSSVASESDSDTE